MSVLSNQLRIRCTRCKRYYTLASLETTQPDPDSKLLHELAKRVTQNGLCPKCQKMHNYAAKQELSGHKTDYNQHVMTPGSQKLPGKPIRVTCENCGEGNHPLRNTCRKCNKPLSQRRLYDARGENIYEEK